MEDSKFENNIDTTVHELIHVLGMSKALYKYFLDPETGNQRPDVVKDWSQ